VRQCVCVSCDKFVGFKKRGSSNVKRRRHRNTISAPQHTCCTIAKDCERIQLHSVRNVSSQRGRRRDLAFRDDFALLQFFFSTHIFFLKEKMSEYSFFSRKNDYKIYTASLKTISKHIYGHVSRHIWTIFCQQWIHTSNIVRKMLLCTGMRTGHLGCA
jgi:hypothetical protein